MTGRPRALGTLLDRARDAVGAEDGDAAGRDLVDLVDETRALGAQPLDDVAVVHDLVPDVDRRAVLFERALDDLDRAFDPGAETSRLSQHDPHDLASPPDSRPRPPTHRIICRRRRAATNCNGLATGALHRLHHRRVL